MTKQVNPSPLTDQIDDETPLDAWLEFAEATDALNSSLDGAGAWPEPARPRHVKPSPRRR